VKTDQKAVDSEKKLQKIRAIAEVQETVARMGMKETSSPETLL
jgi:hypothetical protein